MVFLALSDRKTSFKLSSRYMYLFCQNFCLNFVLCISLPINKFIKFTLKHIRRFDANKCVGSISYLFISIRRYASKKETLMSPVHAANLVAIQHMGLRVCSSAKCLPFCSSCLNVFIYVVKSLIYSLNFYADVFLRSLLLMSQDWVSW